MRTPRETSGRSSAVRRILVIALVLSMLMMMGALLAACGDDVTTTTAGSPSSTATGSASTSATGSASTTAPGSASTTETGSSDTTAGTTSTTEGGVEVLIENFAFDPDPVTVKAGGNVTWTNRDSAFHRLVGDKGEFDSGDIPAAGTFTFAFKTAGTIAYHCSLHPTMTGTIAVE